jgi:hypothetical protein
MEGMMENTFMNVKNRSKTVTAEIEVPTGGASGALLVQGAVSADGPSTCATANPPTNTTGSAWNSMSWKARKRCQPARRR